MGTTSQKLTYLSETKTQLKDMINYGLDTGEKITSETTFRNYVKSLFDAFIKTMTYPDVLYNNLPKVTGTGTSVTLNGTTEAPMRVELSPSALEQETTTGANLINRAICDEDKGLVWARGDTFSDTNSLVSNYIKVEANESLSFNYKAQVLFYDSSQNYLGALKISSGSATIIVGTGTYENQITIPNVADVYYMRLGFRTSQNDNIDMTAVDIMVNKGSSLLPYEEYTGGIASPNPQYPQQIHTVSGENEIKINSIQVTHLDGYVSQSSGRGIFKSDTDDTMVFPVIQGHKYIIHNPNGNRNRGAIFTDIPTNNTYAIVNTYNSSIPNDTEYEASATGYMAVYIQTPHSQSVVNEFYVYEVGKLQTYPLSLGNLEYCKIGDYEDGFVKESRNIFDKDNVEYKDGYYINDNGVENTNASTGYTTSYVEVKPNVQYTISGTFAIGTGYLRIYYYNENKIFLSRSGSQAVTTGSYTFTTPTNCAYVQFQYQVNGVDFNTIQIEEGSQATEYVSFGTYKWYLRKNIGKVVLDGSESWNVYTTTDSQGNTYGYYVPLSLRPLQETHTATFALSNHFIQNRRDAVTVIDTQGIYLGSGVSLFIKIAQSLISGGTLANFKTWLSEHNTTVYYVLATPTYTLLSDTLQTQLDNIQKAITYQDQTNVSQTNNDLPFVIKMSAIRDLSGIFEEI